jgi:hypothetical protein
MGIGMECLRQMLCEAPNLHTQAAGSRYGHEGRKVAGAPLVYFVFFAVALHGKMLSFLLFLPQNARQCHCNKHPMMAL